MGAKGQSAIGQKEGFMAHLFTSGFDSILGTAVIEKTKNPGSPLPWSEVAAIFKHFAQRNEHYAGVVGLVDDEQSLIEAYNHSVAWRAKLKDNGWEPPHAPTRAAFKAYVESLDELIRQARRRIERDMRTSLSEGAVALSRRTKK